MGHVVVSVPGVCGEQTVQRVDSMFRMLVLAVEILGLHGLEQDGPAGVYALQDVQADLQRGQF